MTFRLPSLVAIPLAVTCLINVQARELWHDDAIGIFGVSSDGDIRQSRTIYSVETSAGDRFVFTLRHQVEASVKEGARSVLTLPQATTFLVATPEGILWKSPYGLTFTLPPPSAESRLRPNTGLRIETGENNEYKVVEADGTEYTYLDGNLTHLKTENGRYLVRSNAGRILSVQDEATREIYYELVYDSMGEVASLTCLGGETVRFVREHRLLKAVLINGDELFHFAYVKALISTWKIPGRTYSFDWMTNPWEFQGYTPWTAPVLLRSDALASYDYSLIRGGYQIKGHGKKGSTQTLVYDSIFHQLQITPP